MKLFGEFGKVEDQDDGTLRVEGFASSEAVDSDGETITASAMKAAIPDYMLFGAVREMHQPLAAGTALEMAVEDDGRTRFVAHVVDPVAVKKVRAGVYKGFSIGGKVTGRDPLEKTTITGLRLTEVSLVDRPANPAAVLTMYKADVRSTDDDLTTDDPAQSVEESAASPSAPADAGQALSATETRDPVAVDVLPASSDVEKAEEGARGDEVRKGLGSVAMLADVLQSASWIAQDTAWEAEWEQDGSPIPAKLKAWLADGAAILRDMSAEEADEAVAAITLPTLVDTADTVAMADTAGDLAKAGARHSKSDQSLVQGMHDQALALGAACPDCPTCGTAKVATATGTDALTKAEADRDEAIESLGKAITERDTLTKRVQQLEKLPVAPKGPLRAIAKGEELAAPDAAATAITEADDVASAIRKVHQSGGVRLRF